MKPAFAYLRVSGKNQIEGDGLTRQLTACTVYAQTHDFKVLKVFSEEGISGTNELADRPALSDLFATLADYKEDPPVVLIEKLDRLARDVVVQEVIIRDMIAHQWKLVSTMEPDSCDNDPTRKFIRQIFGALSEYDREMIVLKLRSARQRMKTKTGRCEGVKPYGSLPGEEVVLLDIRSCFRRGMTPFATAQYLNSHGILARSGKAWTASTLLKIRNREKACSPNQGA